MQKKNTGEPRFSAPAAFPSPLCNYFSCSFDPFSCLLLCCLCYVLFESLIVLLFLSPATLIILCFNPSFLLVLLLSSPALAALVLLCFIFVLCPASSSFLLCSWISRLKKNIREERGTRSRREEVKEGERGTESKEGGVERRSRRNRREKREKGQER